MIQWLRKVVRWWCNKDELDRIGDELQAIRRLLETATFKPKPVLAPIQPLGRLK